jgi:ubiquinone/menaquinone biosynthesis C-methylase UbiE
MNERVFHGGPEALRSQARMELMEVDRVVALSIENLAITSVLDVGTGTAIFAEAFAKNDIKTAGIDINDKMVAEAQRMVPQGEFKIGSAENIPFDNGAFDLIFFGHVLHEADDMVKALSEARRVARKRIVVLEWPYVQEEKGPPLEHRLTPESIKNATFEAGLGKVEVLQMKHMILYRIDSGSIRAVHMK